MKREVRVELKNTIARTGWNYSLSNLAYIVCWKNRWLDFEKPVIVVKDLMVSLNEAYHDDEHDCAISECRLAGVFG